MTGCRLLRAGPLGLGLFLALPGFAQSPFQSAPGPAPPVVVRPPPPSPPRREDQIVPPAPAAADGIYLGRLRCAEIPSLTLGPVDVEFSLTVRGATATYQRPILSYDGRQTVGQETGSGTVGADGNVVLQGGVTGRLGTFSARYTGRLAGTRLDLSGTESFTAPRQYERSCSISVSRN
jgi:hypothetical protein